MRAIPKNWKNYTFGDIVKFSGGAQPPRSTFLFKPTEGYIRLIQTRDYKSDKYMTFIPVDKARKKCIKDDIMIGRYGPPIFQILRGLEGAYNVALLKAIPDEKKLDKEYLYYFISQYNIWAFIENLSQRSGGQTGVDLEQLRKHSFPLPPLPEQQKIAEILSTVDAKIEIIDQQIAETQELKKGLMQQLLTKGIGHTEFKDSALGKIPKSWEVVKLKDVAEYVKDGTHGTHKEVEAGIPLLSAKDIRNGKIHIPDNCRKLSNDDFNSIHRNFKLMDGDVLLTVVGSIGRIAIIEGYKNNYTFQRSVGYVRFNNENYPYFFKQFFQSEFFTKQLSLRSNASAQAGVYLGELSKIPIPVISYNEQKEIAEILTSFDDKLQVLSEKKTTYQELKQGLMQQLLTGKVRV